MKDTILLSAELPKEDIIQNVTHRSEYLQKDLERSSFFAVKTHHSLKMFVTFLGGLCV